MSFDADLYTLLHRGVPGDVAFYTDLSAPGSRVLELGCGDGRISQALAKAGRHIVGLDNHPGMLALAEARRRDLEIDARERLEYRSGDMRDFNFVERFDAIIMPFTTVFCLTDVEKSACFKRVFTHLNPGGVFALDTYCPAVFDDPDWANDDALEPLTTIIDGERSVEVSEMTVVDQEARIARVTYGHEIGEDAGQHLWCEYVIEHHYCSTDELASRLAASGFADVVASAGFSAKTQGPEAERVVLVARRSA